MKTRALSVYLGREAARRIADQGWDPELFSLLMGASGGPKWFILSQLDRVMFGDFLQRSTLPLSTVGSSIGSWRHACLAMPDPAAAIAELEHGYLYQHYTDKPSSAEVSEVSLGILQNVLGDNGARELVNHRRIKSHIVTARGKGAAAASASPLLAAGMGIAALGNVVNRNLLTWSFQRVVFHSGESARPEFNFHDFQTCYARLSEDNVKNALHASGSIPFVLSGEHDIAGGPPGRYWDGGIVDYHFNLADHCGEGLILYPHFSAGITPGWFDKFLPWRRSALHETEKLVLLCPNEQFVAQLPQGKIPDRSDFTRMDHDARVRYWENCVSQSKALAEEFYELINQSDPLAGVTVLP
ncbi:MAG: patatin-like phospholipase family protein [Halioglobus sp.]